MQDSQSPPGVEDELQELQKRKLIAEIKELEARANQHEPKLNWLFKNVSFLTFLVALIGVPIGLWQYFEKAENEYRRPLWEKQLNYYLEATRAAATIATLRTDSSELGKTEFFKAKIRFWELYYGELVVVEDPSVSQAMVNFGKCLRDYEVEGCDQRQLQKLSLDLAKVCRNSVSASWKQPLGDVGRVEE